jgi:hypothetical protein
VVGPVPRLVESELGCALGRFPVVVLTRWTRRETRRSGAPMDSRVVTQSAGWAGEVALPGLPQIRTCPIKASGSLELRVRYARDGGVNDRDAG